MDYFQGVVTEYLRASRSVFVNTECLIQLDAGDKQMKNRHWYCDAMAVSFKESTIYLCEVTYSAKLQDLLKRLQAWRTNWDELKAAVLRDSGAPSDFKVQPWIFIPTRHHSHFTSKFVSNGVTACEENFMPNPRVTYLENIVPWNYRTWDRKHDLLAGDISGD